MVSDTETPSVAESPVASPICIVTEERDLQQQVRGHVTLISRRDPVLFSFIHIGLVVPFVNS